MRLATEVERLEREPNPADGPDWRSSFCERLCPEKADMFSGSQSHQRKSQKLCSLGRIPGGNEPDEADRQSRHEDCERVTWP